MKRIFWIISALIILPISAWAQEWPQAQDPFVNDFANLIAANAEAELRGKLDALHDDTGIEMVVVTLPSRAPYQSNGGTLEDFGIGLFNAWKVGDPEKNDGILMLVLPDDRETTIELGAGYPAADSGRARNIIDTIMLRAFREGEYETGILDGADAVLTEIAGYELKPAGPVPVPGGQAPDAKGSPGASDGAGWLLWAIGAAFAALIGWMIFGRRVKDRLSTCPECGKKGLHSERQVETQATLEAEGKGVEITTCDKCGYEKREAFTLPRLAPKQAREKTEFGGGKSQGGGASGKW